MPEDLRPIPPRAPAGPARGCIGGALVVIGALILVPSGLCTAILGLGGIDELVTNLNAFERDVSAGGMFFLAVAAVAAVGALLIFVGNGIRNR